MVRPSSSSALCVLITNRCDMLLSNNNSGTTEIELGRESVALQYNWSWFVSVRWSKDDKNESY